MLAMVCLHLFDTLDYQGKFMPLIFLSGRPLIFYFAQLSDCCVMIFAFCSGYAHMSQFREKQYYRRRLIGLLGVYMNYWVVLVLFSLISLGMGKGSYMPGDLKTFIGNFTTVHFTYNGSWWYLFTYALLTFTSPVLLHLSIGSGRGKTFGVILLTGIVYVSAYYERFELYSPNWFLKQFGLYGMTVAEYMMGSIAYEHKVFTRLGNLWDRAFPNGTARKCVSVFLVLILLLGRTIAVPSLFVAPVSGAALLFLFQVAGKPRWLEKTLLVIGDHSTNIWLTHMFFYLYLFSGLVYLARYPVFVFLLMVAITMAVSVLVNAIHRPLFERVKNQLMGRTDEVPKGSRKGR